MIRCALRMCQNKSQKTPASKFSNANNLSDISESGERVAYLERKVRVGAWGMANRLRRSQHVLWVIK
ncbi:hypothetical protein RRG08_014293 [Elysia crispata]|uniref:Uncharacterized protein n=1 Tax=Elysia crispata TaxID=231223 RepID=A0AAE1ECW2_9GAST|nr:hypothetical protein RRG08_014293 [Elysia crispata]